MSETKKKEIDLETQERFKEAVFQELETMRKQMAQTVEAVATIAQAVAEMKETRGQPQEQGKKPPDLVTLVTAYLLRDLQGDKKPVESFTKDIENMARMAEALDRIRNPPDYEGVFAKRVLMKTGTKAITHGGFPRYMTKEELKKYDEYLNKAFGLEEESEEGGHEHI